MTIKSMVTEADYITTQLIRKYNLPFQVINKVGAPSYWMYPLRQIRDVKFSELSKIADDLATDIYEFRGGGTQTISVTAVAQPMHLQVTRADPQVLRWEFNKTKCSPFEVCIGGVWRSEKPSAVRLDLSRDEFATGGVFGAPGSGKSTVLHNICASLMRSTGPEQVEIYGIDLEQNAFAQYADLPQVRKATGDEQEALKLLTYISELCTSAKHPNDGKLRVLFIDELQMLLNESTYAPEFLALLVSIFQRGRKWGVRVITGTQDPNKNNFPPVLKPLTRWMVAGLTPIDTYLVNQLKIVGARDLIGMGDMLIYASGGRQRFNSFRFDGDEKISEVLSLKEIWGSDNSQMELAEEVAPPVDLPAARAAGSSGSMRAQAKAQRDAEIIAPHMDEAYDLDEQDLQNGYGVRLLELLYGEPKPMAGNYAKRLRKAVAAWEANQANERTNLTNERTNEQNEADYWVIPNQS